MKFKIFVTIYTELKLFVLFGGCEKILFQNPKIYAQFIFPGMRPVYQFLNNRLKDSSILQIIGSRKNYFQNGQIFWSKNIYQTQLQNLINPTLLWFTYQNLFLEFACICHLNTFPEKARPFLVATPCNTSKLLFFIIWRCCKVFQ